LYPRHRSRIRLSYMGVPDNGINPFDPAVPFTLVSCSSLIKLKRVHLIAGILQHIPFEINWIHWGGGETEAEVKKLSETLPANVKAIFKGQAKNQDIIAFYKSVPVNLFITTSETEGLPVSIQEAISFGIPVIATNVGGIPEIVNEHTGMLVEKDFDNREVAQMILDFKNSERNSEGYREGVRKFWMEHFNAGKNYQLFYEYLVTGTN
jgi:glycosyltransferase involved in cell wall biosynthesis